MICDDCIYRFDCKNAGTAYACDMHVSENNEIPWRSAKMERPEKSTERVIVKHLTGYQVVSYSKLHDRFNCHDFYSEEEIKRMPDYFADVTHWAYLPEKIL